jgi:hypothetical protein
MTSNPNIPVVLKFLNEECLDEGAMEVPRLENEGTNNIQNRAALLTVVQQVAGEL